MSEGLADDVDRNVGRLLRPRESRGLKQSPLEAALFVDRDVDAAETVLSARHLGDDVRSLAIQTQAAIVVGQPDRVWPILNVAYLGALSGDDPDPKRVGTTLGVIEALARFANSLGDTPRYHPICARGLEAVTRKIDLSARDRSEGDPWHAILVRLVNLAKHLGNPGRFDTIEARLLPGAVDRPSLTTDLAMALLRRPSIAEADESERLSLGHRFAAAAQAALLTDTHANLPLARLRTETAFLRKAAASFPLIDLQDVRGETTEMLSRLHELWSVGQALPFDAGRPNVAAVLLKVAERLAARDPVNGREVATAMRTRALPWLTDADLSIEQRVRFARGLDAIEALFGDPPVDVPDDIDTARQTDTSSVLRRRADQAASGLGIEAARKLLNRARKATRRECRQSLKDDQSLLLMLGDRGNRTSTTLAVDFAEVFAAVPEPDEPKGIVVYVDTAQPEHFALTAPLLLRLKARGYVVRSLFRGLLPRAQKTGTQIRIPNGIIPGGRALSRPTALTEPWLLDPERRSISCRGTEYFDGFRERLAMQLRRGTLDWRSGSVKDRLRQALELADRILSALRLFDAKASASGLPLYFLGNLMTAVPNAIVRDYCGSGESRAGAQCLYLSPAFALYYQKRAFPIVDRFSLVNVTRRGKSLRAPFLTERPAFDAWCAAEGGHPAAIAQIDALLNVRRSPHAAAEEARMAVVKMIEARRSAGQSVILVLGKLTFDLGVPVDGGPGHRDMADWLDHTVETAGRTDALFLVKPHPYEDLGAVAKHVTERFVELTSRVTPSNWHVMDSAAFTLSDIAPLIDLAVGWNGTSLLELTALGVATVMSSHYAALDYPIAVVTPTSRDDYARILTAPASVPNPSEAERLRARQLIAYLGSDEFGAPYRYGRISASNALYPEPSIDLEAIATLAREGEPRLDAIIDRELG